MSGFYIVNDFDKPDERHVAQVVEVGKAQYLHEDLRGFGSLQVDPKWSSTMEAFGFDVDILNGIAHFSLVRDSIATYNDGKPRQWQGRKKTFTLKMIGQEAEEDPTQKPMTFDFSFGLRCMKDLKKITRGRETFAIKVKNGVARIYVLQDEASDYVWRPTQVDLIADDWRIVE
jgi:hypothetical protein